MFSFICAGISQRDLNHYEFFMEKSTRDKISRSVTKFWEEEIKDTWPGNDCMSCLVSVFVHLFTSPFHDQSLDIFDFLLTRDLSRGHIIDFNPYSPRTDALLFSYKELHALSQNPPPEIEFRVISSSNHPAAISNIPVFQHNMVPLEALSLSSGRTPDEFAEALKECIQGSMQNGQ